MTSHRRTPARAIVRAATGAPQARARLSWFGGLALGALAAATAWGESHEAGEVDMIVSHGFNEYDALKYGPDLDHLDYVNVDAPIGGELSISTIGTFDSMNAYATRRGTPAALSTFMYEDLMTSTSDEVGSYYCLLCTTIEYPETQDWVIFNLRDDVTFSDGTPMTAEDVVFTHNLLLEQGTPSYAAYVSQVITGAEVLDPHRVKFTFAEGIPRKGLIAIAGGTPAWSKAWYEKTGARLDESRLEVSPGTGEYMLDTIDVGRRVTLRRNPDYWGADHPLMRGRGNYDTIRIEYFADSSAAFEAFKAGEYTFRQENSSIQWATGYDFPAVQNGTVKIETLADGTLPAATGFVFNLRDPKFQDRNLRRALGLMFNFTWTNQNLQYGLFTQREGFWENERLKAAGLPEGLELEYLEEFRDQLPEEIFTEPAVLPHESGDRPLDRGNQRKALRLLREAGYEPGSDGMLRDASGKTLDIEFIEDTQSFDRIITPYIENLKALGVNAVYRRIDPSQYQSRTQTNDFEMRFDAYRNGLVESSGILQRYGCDDRDDVFNPAGYCSPVVDALAQKVLEAQDYDQMSAAIRAIDRVMRYDYFIVPVWMLQENWVAYYDMYAYPETLPEFGLGYLDYWWIDPEKEAALKSAGAL